MKFKINSCGDAEINITDKDGDKLELMRAARGNGKLGSKLCVTVSTSYGSCATVVLPRAQALKLARAIIAEFEG